MSGSKIRERNVNEKFWVILNWAGTPLPSNPGHNGWSEIEYFTLELSRAASARVMGNFAIGIGMDSSSMVLTPVLMHQLCTGGCYPSVAIDITTPEGGWVRNEFRNVSVSSSRNEHETYRFDFEFERVQFKQITVHRR
jgi:hypothetical protein